MKKVGIHGIYVEHFQVLKIFPTFIASHNAKNGS